MKDSSRVSIALSASQYSDIKSLAKQEGKTLEETAEGLLRGKLADVCRKNKSTGIILNMSEGLKSPQKDNLA